MRQTPHSTECISRKNKFTYHSECSTEAVLLVLHLLLAVDDWKNLLAAHYQRIGNVFQLEVSN